MQTFMVPLFDFQTFFHEYTVNILHRYLYPKSHQNSIDKHRTQHNNTLHTRPQHTAYKTTTHCIQNTHNSLFHVNINYRLNQILDKFSKFETIEIYYLFSPLSQGTVCMGNPKGGGACTQSDLLTMDMGWGVFWVIVGIVGIQIVGAPIYLKCGL